MSNMNNNQTLDLGSIPVRVVGGGAAVQVAGVSGGSGVNIASGGFTTPVTVAAGSYIIAALAGNWGGATLTMQTLGPDGVTYQGLSTAVTFTANGQKVAVVGTNAVVQFAVTGGNITGLFLSMT